MNVKFQDAEGLKKKRYIRHCSLDCASSLNSYSGNTVLVILPLIEILKFDWLIVRQILYAAILCFLTNLIFLIYPLHVTYLLTTTKVTICNLRTRLLRMRKK